MGRDLHRRDALDAPGQVTGGHAVQRLDADPVWFGLTGQQVHPLELPLAGAVDDVRVHGVRNDGAGLAARSTAPVVQGVRIGQAGDDDRRIVLLRTVQLVGEGVVHPDAVDLGRGLVHLCRPGRAPVERDVGAAVVRLDHRLPVERVDPDVVVVAVRGAHPLHGVPAVGGLEEALGAGIDHVGVGGVGTQRRVVERPLDHRTLRVDELPAPAGVVGPVEAAARLGLDECVDAVGVRRCHGEVALADQFGGQTVRDPLPRLAAVGALIETALAGAADDGPGLALDARHPRVHHVGIARLELNVHGAGAVGDCEDLTPRPSAVRRLEHAALGVGFEGIPVGRDPDDVRVGRVDAHAADLSDFVESRELPRLAAVGAPVDPSPGRDVAAQPVGACAEIDHVGIGVGDRD